MKYKLAAATALTLLSSVATADLSIIGNQISWPDDGWYQVQRISERQTVTTICEGGRYCEVMPGKYKVRNFTTGELFPQFNVTANPTTVYSITVTGNTIRWPRNNGWYQVQDENYKSVCNGGLACRVETGTYTVINASTGQRTPGVEVEASFTTTPSSIITPPSDIVVTFEDGITTYPNGITVEGNTISWPVNDNWYQVQTRDYRQAFCGGARSCRVDNGTYVVTNHTTNTKTRDIVVSADEPVRDPYVSADCSAKRDNTGLDVILLIGQSNMSGYGQPWTAPDGYTNSRIRQLAKEFTTIPNIIYGSEPLQHSDWFEGRKAVGMGMSFATEYLNTLPENRQILLVPAAKGSTGLLNGYGPWTPGRELFNDAVRRLQATLKLNRDNCVAAILWHQGETDVDNLNTNYKQNLHNMIDAFRSQVPRAAEAPFILGQFTSQWTGAGRDPNQQAVLESIANVINDTPDEKRFTAVASSSGLTANPDLVHFSADAQRQYGRRYFEALSEANTNTR